MSFKVNHWYKLVDQPGFRSSHVTNNELADCLKDRLFYVRSIDESGSVTGISDIQGCSIDKPTSGVVWFLKPEYRFFADMTTGINTQLEMPEPEPEAPKFRIKVGTAIDKSYQRLSAFKTDLDKAYEVLTKLEQMEIDVNGIEATSDGDTYRLVTKMDVVNYRGMIEALDVVGKMKEKLSGNFVQKESTEPTEPTQESKEQ